MKKIQIIKPSFHYLLLLPLMFFVSCHKDVSETKIVDTRIPGPEIVEQYDGDLTVLLTDLIGTPIPDATVYVYDQSLESNKEGIASFKNIPLDKTGTHVKALKEGYLFGSNIFHPTETENYIVVQMLPIQNLSTFNSTDNVAIEIQGGGQLQIESGTFEYPDGTPYNQEVSLFSYYINPEQTNYGQQLPGDHTGIAKNGSTKALEIMSSVAVFAYDQEGADLQIKDGKTIALYAPVSADKVDLLPETMSSWNFDENLTTWTEADVAFRDDQSVLMDIQSLGFWSCARASNFKYLKGRVQGSNGRNMSHITVQLESDFSVGATLTDGNGSFYLKVPEQKDMKLQLTHPACNEILYQENVEALSNDFELEDIIINTSDVPTLSGFINCNSEAVTNGLVYCKTAYYTYVIEADEQGQFSLFLLEALCDNTLEFELYGIDQSTDDESVELTYSYAEGNDLIVDVCADCNFQINVTDEILDYCDLLVQLTVNVQSGSGDYSYNWEDGSSGISVTVTENEDFCITVTDNVTMCQVTGCKSFIAPDQLLPGSISKQMIDCYNFGSLDIEMVGGKLPYNFSWTGPGGFVSNEAVVSDLSEEGTYVYVVTDGNDCTYEGYEVVENIAVDIDLNVSTTDFNNVICDDEPKILFLDCASCGVDLSTAEWILPDGSNYTGQELNADLAGIYQVTFNSLNCFAEGSIQLQKADFNEPIIDYNCLGNGNYEPYVTNLESGYSAEFPILTAELMIYEFNLFVNAEYTINSPYASCSKTFDLDLPRFDGMSIEAVNHTSCDTCDDGSINLIIDAQNCSNCIFEDYYIYREEDLLTDLKIQNSQNNLEAGNYYVVAKSEEGCILNSFSVIIE